MLDLDEPPKNKLRKVIFKYNSKLTKEEKLRIVGELIGRSKHITEDDIYNCMLEINNNKACLVEYILCQVMYMAI